MPAPGDLVADLGEPFCRGGRGDENHRLAVFEEMLQFVRRRKNAQGDGDGADFRGGEVGDDELGAVGKENGHLVPFFTGRPWR